MKKSISITILCLLFTTVAYSKKTPVIDANESFKASLPNGTAVELVAVCDFNDCKLISAHHPDGTEYNEPITFIENTRIKGRSIGLFFRTNKSVEIGPINCGRFGYLMMDDSKKNAAFKKEKILLFYNPENFIDHNSIEVSVEEKWQGRTKFDGKYSIGRYDPKIKFIEAYQTQAGVKVVFENGYDDVPSTQSRLIGSAETNQKLNNGKLQKRHQQLIGKMGYVRSADGKKLSSALFSQQRDLSFGLSDFRYFELRTRSEPFLVRFKNVKFPFAEKITKEESGL